ncbi:dynamin family protein, partial [Arthrospira platensis SPKY1]|nr:dynamin family protein [Arthrospira platensis SPKY1]
PKQIAQTLQQVTHTTHVSAGQAHAMGLLGDESHPKQAEALVEVPKWRHAMLNIDLPLLRQGLVVIDTPGLNAVGVEPELTLGLLNQVDAVVFVLAADLGVSQSDLDMWQNHLLPPSETQHNRLAVLNKIDILWDDLTPEVDIAHQLLEQKSLVMQCLG